MTNNEIRKLTLKKQTISQLTMMNITGGLTLTWDCSEEGGWTCHTCEFECNSLEIVEADRA